MKPKTAIFLIALLALVAWCVYADTIDKSNRTDRYRTGSKITFDTTSTVADEDAAWSMDNPQLGRLSLVLAGTTNQLIFRGTNTAPASTTIVKWVSVQISGETNAYRIGLAW